MKSEERQRASTEADPRAGSIVAPDWYAEMIGAPLVAVRHAVEARWGSWLASVADRIGPLRGLLIWLAVGRDQRVAMIKGTAGVVTFATLDRLTRRPRRLVLVEMIDRPLPRGSLARLAYRCWSRLIERPGLRSAAWRVHLLSETERDAYARRYRFDPTRLVYVPWGLSRAEGGHPVQVDPGNQTVFSSGRTHCDWETLFAAARERGWKLAVACGASDLERVRVLNHDRFAEVHCELSRQDHHRLLESSAVFCICLRPVEVSVGHVRLSSAIESGIPVVATDVPALSDYLVNGATGLSVPPNDARALGDAVDRLLADDGLRLSVRDAALDRAAIWTYPHYFEAIARMLGGDRAEVPAELRGGSR